MTEEKKAPDTPKAPKSEQTRTLILETALRLFRELSLIHI